MSATECERLGHDDAVTYEGDGLRIWVCRRCGAEGWEDKEPEGQGA